MKLFVGGFSCCGFWVNSVDGVRILGIFGLLDIGIRGLVLIIVEILVIKVVKILCVRCFEENFVSIVLIICFVILIICFYVLLVWEVCGGLKIYLYFFFSRYFCEVLMLEGFSIFLSLLCVLMKLDLCFECRWMIGCCNVKNCEGCLWSLRCLWFWWFWCGLFELLYMWIV